ncbi:glycoside hydrolase family 97 protein [Pararcticibacter amylolyticus]|uniref:Retaining alpha-galactosidase n=1 Tax=Pararcticibacter amylolyticus TaxID=2173175 RepID=A0A2U2PHP8_9SPHI|nr:glycoside hydrolase family 97 protein [Pararcticibacter amylolyticus]PWG80938.1 Retaining alpha-galactosidase [Pararcticibacter amylolyticus]
MKYLLFTIFLFTLVTGLHGQKKFELKSPDGKLAATVSAGSQVSYSVSYEGDILLKPSSLSMELDKGVTWGRDSKLQNAKTSSVRQEIDAHFYKRNKITDHYNELTLHFRENFSLIFRAYNEGIAYRFVSTGTRDIIVKNEEASFNFDKDYSAYVPYVKGKFKDTESQFFNSFENEYTYAPLSRMNRDKLAFTPLVVCLDKGRKICLAESDLESYPGMFLSNKTGSLSLSSSFAPYPAAAEQGGHNQLQQLVTSRQPYIAKSKAKSRFPWRIIIVSAKDKELADNDMVYKLASPTRLTDLSWIKPGKVAWEWWNHWGLSNVDFEAGVNNDTYKAYIDFASKNKIEYVILDEGWAVNLKADMFSIVPEIDLKNLVAYANSKNVGLILWAGYYAFERDMERVCRHYSEMGIKGFKIDFMDRDDQQMVDFHYRAAVTAAKYKMLVDFHGTYKPTGINRTYPNVINFEAVHGLEQMKWTGPELDQVTYDVTMPFIRMVAGPVDYTQGAMRNATKRTHRGINDEPMSQGTRCRQLAEYVIFESPLNMLCDSPTSYEKEQECTNFISAVPTVWDNTVALDGKIGQYLSIARRKADVWYVGALTNWDARKLELDLSFLDEGDYMAEVYRDGANANRIASDYKKETIAVPSNRKLTVSMAQGGGFAMKIYKK